MKKCLIPILLTAVVVCVSYFFQRYTLVCQEYDGLFLWAPDYWRWALSRPLPVSQALSDFLTQFYRVAAWGPWLVGLQVLAMYLIVRLAVSVLREGLPTVAACGEWLVIALSRTAKPGVAVLLLTGLFCLVFRLLRKGKRSGAGWAQTGVSVAILALCALFVALCPKVRRTETWAQVKSGVIFGKPGTVLKAATPARVRADRELTPFALLALGEQFELSSRLFEYPVYEENDLDMCLEEDYYNSLFFRAFLYDALGCGNEACHQLFQLATQQEHGMSFLVLRQLVKEYYLLGNYALTEKYCKILDRSATHRKFVAAYRQLMAEGTPREPDSSAESAAAPLINRNPLFNLIRLSSESPSDFAVDRLLCTFLLQRDLSRFATAFEAAVTAPRFSQSIPRVYQEAMLLYYEEENVPMGQRVNYFSPHTMGAHRRFMQRFLAGEDVARQQADYGDTYWFYYYFTE